MEIIPFRGHEVPMALKMPETSRWNVALIKKALNRQLAIEGAEDR